MAHQLLTAEEVGHILRIHPKTVYAWARSGILPAARLGPATVRFRPEDVDRLVADRLTEVPA